MQVLERIANDESKRIEEKFESETTLTGIVGVIQDTLVEMPKLVYLIIGQFLEETGAITFDPDDTEEPS